MMLKNKLNGMRINLRKRLYRNVSIAICLICVFSFVQNPKSAQPDSLYYTNPNYQIANELFNRKIVMLGDYGPNHHQPASYRRLMCVLYNWLNLAKASGEKRSLSLVVENDEPTSFAINRFISDGNMKAFTDTIKSEFYLETLEHLIDLRNFSGVIDSVNMLRENKISFTVKGFEQVGYINFERIAKLSSRDDEFWFVHERDSVTANGIINYKNNNPEEQILVFYGYFHLQNRLLDKRRSGNSELSPEEGWGYCLAHFLKKEFGKSNVLTIDPRSFIPEIFDNTIFEHLKDKEFLLRTETLPVEDEDKPDIDLTISCKDKFVSPINAEYVCSRYILEKLVNKINDVKKWLPGGFKALNQYYIDLSILQYITGYRFVDDNELRAWLNKTNYDSLNLLYSNKFTNRLSYMFINYPDEEFINSVLSNFGSSYIVNDKSLINLEKWETKELPKILEQVKFSNSIGVYWLGYEEEKIKAKEFLVKFSGKDFNEPEKYLKWYRVKYFGTEY